MAIITKADLSTHLYAEIIEEITRTDDTIITRTIDTAESTAKAYLSKYDLVALFGTNLVLPTVNSHLLINIVKDITCWHLIRLSNPNINLELFRTNFEDAIKLLERIQKNQAEPEGWPLKPIESDIDPTDNSSVVWSSNKKRSNYF
jgi:hypothetical protein